MAKAYRDGFRPIHLVIETEEEAKALWHRLNAAQMHFDKYIDNVKGDFPDIKLADLNPTSLWSALNEVYSPSPKIVKG